MPESIQIALGIYFMGFAIAIITAALIKGLHGLIRRFSPENNPVQKNTSEE